jgi:hypothetical protein
VKSLISLVALLLASGCATMVNGTHQEVPVRSEPSGARVRYDCGDSRGEVTTPATIALQRAAEHCSLTVTKAGYADQTVLFERQRSKATEVNRVPGAIAGATLGVIGLFLGLDASAHPEDGAEVGWVVGNAAGTLPAEAIDAKTGGAYKQVPKKVYVRLDPLP